MQIDDIYIDLIVREFKNETSEYEKQELFRWVYAEKENEELFYYLKDIWQTARFESISEEADTDSEWERFITTGLAQGVHRFHKRKKNIKVFYRAIQFAAVVVFTLCVTLFFQNYKPEDINYASISVPYGAKSELELPDGSKVWVNSGSKIIYPTNIEDGDATIFLEGEAYFEIVKNPKRTLNVKTSTINIRVHGTTFNVKSYCDEEVVETTLLEGSISITGKVGNKIIENPIFLKPNEQATLTKESQSIVKIGNSEHQSEGMVKNQAKMGKMPSVIRPNIQIKEGVDAESYVMWKSNKLVFRNERFEDLAVRLERWYNVEITIKGEELKDSRYTGIFENETIEQALQALSISLPFKFQMDKNQILIRKE